MKLKVKRRIFVTCLLISVIIISSLSIAASSFTIEKFWKVGGKIGFELYGESDSDYDYTEDWFTGTHILDEINSEGNLVINTTLKSIAIKDVGKLGNQSMPDFSYLKISLLMTKGDVVTYNFTPYGGLVDFYIFEFNEFWKWLVNDPASPAVAVTYVQTSIKVSDAFNPLNYDRYYFIWYNDGMVNNNGTISVAGQIDVDIKENTVDSYLTEINPETLEIDDDEVPFIEDNSFGEETSDWKVDYEVTYEIEGKEDSLKIIKSIDHEIDYNNESKKIPSWELEIEDYETSMKSSDGSTIPMEVTITLRKCKSSGVTLLRQIESKYIDPDTSLEFLTKFSQYKVVSAENLELGKKGSGISFPLLPVFLSLGILTLIIRRKKS